MNNRNLLVWIAAFFFVAACGGESDRAADTPAPDAAVAENAGTSASSVTAERLLKADAEQANWMTHGRTYDEQRFSPLGDINAENVGDLGLAWYYDIPTKRGMEATPIVVDGVMYVTGSWSIVYALDAATGQERWIHDPGVERSWIQYACCDAVNRGVAVWGDNIYVGTLDGYLLAIDAETGKERWRVDTIDRKPPYTITGAPRIINGLVIIGNGGAEYGVRGYVSAYDADSGELRWRFYTVPGNPADGFENDAMKMAAETWTGEWWKYGGGGTVWDSMAHDPELDLLYIGTGNGSPWNRKIRSPEGGDNLFLSSIVALRPDTGEYVWHYQGTPGDTWDFTATQHIVLADMEIDGAMRKVLMQAPKNGFFYVIDRANGELLSAETYVNVNWATGIDQESGRPIEAPNARYTDGPVLIMPAPFGGHNWHPMAYSGDTGLVYLPAQDLPHIHGDNPRFEFIEGQWNTGTDFTLASAPDDPDALAQVATMVRGQLIAWDPVEQREVWRYQHAGPWNGGVVVTGGGLVFQGSLVGEFAAYDASSGERLWAFSAQTGVAAAPITYSAGNQQHVAVAAGWGTVFALAGGPMIAPLGLQNESRILAFRVGGEASLPPPTPAPAQTVSAPPDTDFNEDQLALGKDVYMDRCWFCHGDHAMSGGIVPDLRYTSAEKHAIWDNIVLEGVLRPLGMPGFGGILSKEDSDAVQAYVYERTKLAYESQQAAAQ